MPSFIRCVLKRGKCTGGVHTSLLNCGLSWADVQQCWSVILETGLNVWATYVLTAVSYMYDWETGCHKASSPGRDVCHQSPLYTGDYQSQLLMFKPGSVAVQIMTGSCNSWNCILQFVPQQNCVHLKHKWFFFDDEAIYKKKHTGSNISIIQLCDPV